MNKHQIHRSASWLLVGAFRPKLARVVTLARCITLTQSMFLVFSLGVMVVSWVRAAEAADWYVRPASQGEYGLEDGASYANAFDGFADVVWGSGGVQAGDRLFVCGTHIYASDFSLGNNVIGLSGNNGSPIIIDGHCPGDVGTIVGTREILSTSGWTNRGDGTFSIPWPWSPSHVFEATEIGVSDEKLLHNASDIPGVTTTDGSSWLDDPGNILYVNPYGSTLKNIYANWGVPALDLNGQSYVTVQNLTLRGGPGNDGTIRINKNDATPSRGIVINNNDIGFASYAAIYWLDDETLDGLSVSSNRIHHVPTGTYWQHNSGAGVSNVSITGNELWSGEDLDGILTGASDRQALGGMSGDNVSITNNYIHDWAGDGITGYRSATLSMNNWTIAYNHIKNLNDTNSLYYHYGIHLGGTNSVDFGDNAKNWRIHSNVIENLGGVLANNTGICFRIKGVKPSSGNGPLIENNTVSDCNFSMRAISVTGAANQAWTINNNISLNIKSGGYHSYLENTGVADLSGIVMDHNIYSQDTNGSYKWRGSAGATDLVDFISDAAANGVVIENHSSVSDPLLTSSSDFTPLWNSPAIDAGTPVGLTTDYYGNPIYGPDIGAIEYQPPYTMGTDSPDVSANVRLYGDGKFRNTVSPTGTTADLSIIPASNDTTQYLDTAIGTWNNTGTHRKSWTESSTTITGNVVHTVGDLEASKYYTVAVDSNVGQNITGANGTTCNTGVCRTNAQGKLSFTYSGGYSSHVFDVEEGDNTAPTITSVSSDKANGSYTVGEVIDIDVTFSEPVTSTGNVTVTLETGATDRTCVFTVSNASTGTCNYTVQSGDASSDLSVNSLSGTIADQTGNAIVNFTPTTNLAANKALVIDTTLPTITSVSSDKANGSYTVGAVIDIDVTFSEPVTSTGNVTVTLETGATDRTCVFTVSNASTGTCNYTVQSEDASSDLSVNSLSGTIADQTGNAIVNFTPTTNLAANKALVIDTTRPTIISVSSDKPNASYTVGAVIDIDVNFSEPVTSTGNVTVILETGATDRTCTFAITNASTGTCNYTVQSGDASGNQILATTPAVNLSANKAIFIDTTAPHLDITSPAPGETVGGESLVVFTNPESVSAQCSLAGVAWSSCVSGVTKLQELAVWGDISEGAEFSLRIRGFDGVGNLGTDIVSGILKSASRQESGYELGVAWNGFLGLTNVLELENRGQERTDINLRLYDIEGTRLLERGVSLPAHTSQHFVINDLEGFQRNTYGSVSVEVSAGSPGGAGSDIGGQMVFYQFKDNENLGLNYALPLTRGMSGSSYTVFNTYLPWGGMSESALIAQWLSVENISDEAQWFSLNRYDEQGQLLLSSRLYVPARGSRDVEAGHIVPGNNRVGLNELVPDNSSAPYLSHLMRFGGDGSVFEYGLPIVGRRSSDNRNLAVAFSKMLGETNWLEVANVSDTESIALIDCYRSNGDAVGTERAVTLASKAQVHVNLSESLERGDMGHCMLSPIGASGGLLAQNVIYFPASDASRSQSAHEVLSYSAQPASESSEHGSYNLYLGMVNWLKIVNLTGETQSATMNLYQSGSQLSQKLASIPPHAEVDFGLHEESNYGTRADTYGLVELESQRSQVLKSYVLRLRPQHGNQGFGAPMQ